MTYIDAIQKFGLPASWERRPEILQALIAEIEREKVGASGEEMLRTLCLLLFSIGIPEDALLIWAAKQSSFDAGCGIDVQFLCGSGLVTTKNFLANCTEPSASAALEYLAECEKVGDFNDWTPTTTVEQYRSYYGL